MMLPLETSFYVMASVKYRFGQEQVYAIVEETIIMNKNISNEKSLMQNFKPQVEQLGDLLRRNLTELWGYNKT